MVRPYAKREMDSRVVHWQVVPIRSRSVETSLLLYLVSLAFITSIPFIIGINSKLIVATTETINTAMAKILKKRDVLF